ncbi:U1-like zinc finger [Mactra antiquata]
MDSVKVDISKTKKEEQYDPANPTGDIVSQKLSETSEAKVKEIKDEKVEVKDEVKMDIDTTTDSDKKDTEISLTVTVNKKGRSVNDSDKKEDSQAKTKKYKCNVCDIKCYDEESFARHMNGLKHKQKMEVVMTSTSHQAVLIKSRLQAEEHLRQIEEAQKESGKVLPKGKALESHCKVCDKKFTGAYKDHKESKDHKEKEDRRKAGCKICNVISFNTYHDFTSHLKSDWHKKNRLKLKKDDNEEELSDLVTLDTVGFEEETTTETEVKDKTIEETKSPEFRKPLPVTSSTKPLPRSTSLELDEVIPDTYDPNLIVGQKFIVPVAGYFCKICHKFYNNESAAKVTHCQSKSHYERLLKNMEAKKAKAMELFSKTQLKTGTQEEKIDDNEPGTEETLKQNNDELNDSTTMELVDTKECEDEDKVTMETETTVEKSECAETIEIEFTEKPLAKSSPKIRQQKARRGGIRGRGARRN